jgi:dihydroxyacetone kinase
MTRLSNDPGRFADEMVDGFVRARARWVQPVAGGVVRAQRPRQATVAVVTGGGSGHYPAFGGWVGEGLAHGAALGNIFASPSTDQVFNVAAHASMGRGVLLTYGNYAGDVMNFGQAQERLIAHGIPCRTVLVTDDVSSAPPHDLDRRRGICGGLVVYKAAAVAAEAGLSLEEVEQVAKDANARTRSTGIAFGGCTLPGAPRPLFDVPSGRAAVGMGVHGEPGIGEIDVPTADGAADLLVEALLGDVPPVVERLEDGRVAVILNGLGALTHEELFVVYRRVAERLEDQGITIVDPEVGEIMTSLDMPGLSLSITWLDERLESYWKAPADAPAFRKGNVLEIDGLPDPEDAGANGVPLGSGEIPEIASSPGVPATGHGGHVACAALAAISHAMRAHRDELGDLDAIAGDGDHGAGMERGALAALEVAERTAAGGSGAAAVLVEAGKAWAARAGGASGALWGAALQAMGSTLDGESPIDAQAVSRSVTTALEAVRAMGGARVGDKTLIDVLVPFDSMLATRVADGVDLGAAWSEAAAAALASAHATANLTPRIGRARLHGGRSLGTADAGATSLAIALNAVASVLARPGRGHDRWDT